MPSRLSASAARWACPTTDISVSMIAEVSTAVTAERNTYPSGWQEQASQLPVERTGWMNAATRFLHYMHLDRLPLNLIEAAWAAVLLAQFSRNFVLAQADRVVSDGGCSLLYSTAFEHHPATKMPSRRLPQA